MDDRRWSEKSEKDSFTGELRTLRAVYTNTNQDLETRASGWQGLAELLGVLRAEPGA